MVEDVQLTLELAEDSMKKAINHLETELGKTIEWKHGMNKTKVCTQLCRWRNG